MRKVILQVAIFIQLNLVASPLGALETDSFQEYPEKNSTYDEYINWICDSRRSPTQSKQDPPWWKTCFIAFPARSATGNLVSSESNDVMNQHARHSSSNLPWSQQVHVGSQHLYTSPRSSPINQVETPSKDPLELERIEEAANCMFYKYLMTIEWNSMMMGGAMSAIETLFKELQGKYYHEIWSVGVNGDRFRAWLPKLDDLTYTGTTDQRNPPSIGSYMLNVSHYMEYFSCALEQMVFEQSRPSGSEKVEKALDLLSSNLSRIKCYADRMAALMQNVELELLSIRNVPKHRFEASSFYWNVTRGLNSLLGRKLIKSPLLESGHGHAVGDSIHAPRDIMPSEDRSYNFCCPIERNISILKDLRAFLNLHWSNWISFELAHLT